MNQHRGSIICRLVLPIALIVALGCALIGCVAYVPVFEANKPDPHDFRAAVGDEKSGKPIAPRKASRETVERLLGPAPYRSDDRRTVGYTLQTNKGYAVYGLCSSQHEVARRWYLLRLHYGDRGVLDRYDVKTWDPTWEFGSMPRQMTSDDAVEVLGNDGPLLRPTPAASAYQYR